MKNQTVFSSKDRSKKLKCRLLQFLFGALWSIDLTSKYLSDARVLADCSHLGFFTVDHEKRL